jgi:ferritin-like metal-binding protein YciE
MAKLKTLNELFEIELRYAYDCETKLVDKGLPSMIENASSPELKSALNQHLSETREHANRLEKVFAAIGADVDKKDNDVVDKILDAAKDSASNIDASGLRDAALIANGNVVEHYEIATYGTLAAYAKSLGLGEAIVSLLNKTLAEEKAADAKLTQLGEAMLNLSTTRGRTASA